MDRINVAPQRTPRDEFAPAPQAKRSSGSADQRGSEAIQSEPQQETEFSKVTSRIKADHAADKSSDSPEVFAHDDLPVLDMLSDGEKPLLHDQPGLGALLQQSTLAAQTTTVVQTGPTPASGAIEIATDQHSATAASSTRLAAEVLTLRQLSDTAEREVTAGERKSDIGQRGEIPKVAVDRTGVSSQVLRPEALSLSVSRPVAKATGESIDGHCRSAAGVGSRLLSVDISHR